MVALQNRSSAFAVVPEVSEGVPVVPTSAGQYLPIQDDIELVPEFEVLENAELKNSLGKAKSILGAESPTGSASLYLKHSGVEGTSPEAQELYQAIFGAESTVAVENLTTVASTVSALEMASVTDLERGSAVLVKHATLPHEIRPIESIASTTITPAFDMTNAAITGLGTGKAVLFKPANVGHQTVSLWHYVANGGAIQMVSGARPTEMSVSFEAGQLINTNWSFEGLQYYFNPIEITSTDIYLDFTDDQGTVAAIITADMYKDPIELADAIATAMNALTSETMTCVYSSDTGKYTIATTTSTLFSLLWNTGTNTANTVGDKLGFTVASDDTGAITYTSDSAISFDSPQTPSFDDADPLAAKDNEVMIGSASDNVCFHASTVEFTLGVPKTDISDVCAVSGKSGSLPTERTVSITVSTLLEKFEADKFKRFRNNDETKFLYNFGTKTAGNWNPGKCGSLYGANMTITSFSLTPADGLIQLDMELTSFVNSAGDGEVYLSFV